MAPDIVTGESEKSYGVVLYFYAGACHSVAMCGLMKGNVAQAFVACGLAGWSGRFFQICQSQAGDAENGRPAFLELRPAAKNDYNCVRVPTKI
jgi:hypothetical protein